MRIIEGCCMRAPAPLPDGFGSGPFTLAAALARGVTPGRLRSSDLAVPFRGIRSPSARSGRLAMCEAYALRMGPTEAFSHATAAELWGLPLPWRTRVDPRLHTVVWAGVHPTRARAVVGHRANETPQLRRWRGLRVIAAADAWCQLAGELSERDLIVAGDRLIGLPRALATETEIDAAIARYGAKRGARALRRARARLRPRSESPRETLLRLDVIDAGFPEPEPNGVIELASGRRTRADLVFREYRVILEYDGQHHRSDANQWSKDVDRLNELAANGWVVIRVNKDTQVRQVLGLLRHALTARGWA
jgi:hypothetical protein